jgi:membrane-bound lytic murein transglycosylase D
VALAAGTSTDRVAELNPQLVAGRAPPTLPASLPAGLGAGIDASSWTVRVPAGSAARAAQSLPRFADAEAKVARIVVRWGESMDDIAARHGTTRGTLASLNGLHRDESMRPGTVLLVPAPRDGDAGDPFRDVPASKPTVVVPAQSFAVVDPSRKRVFYRVVPGDTLRDVAGLFGVTPDDICRWNDIDPAALLHEGMALQVYPAPGPRRADVLVLDEKDARVLPVGSPEFFAHFEGQRGRTRLELVAKERDTWRTLAHKYGLSLGRGRSTPLNPGDRLVVYVPNAKAKAAERPIPGAKPAKEAAEERATEVLAMTKPIEAGAPSVEEAAGKDDGVVKAATVLVPVSLGAGAGAVVHEAPAAASR